LTRCLDFEDFSGGRFATLMSSIRLLFGKFSLSDGGIVRFKTLRVESAYWLMVDERSISIMAGYTKVEGLKGPS